MLLPIATLALALLAAPVLPQKFYPDDPILVDRDDLPIDEPAEIELSPTYDLLENTFAPVPLELPIPRAMNANTLGEVPDSSWFGNRIGVRDMTLEELARGPNRSGPPSLPLTVVDAKSSGISSGFTARDASGRTFFVKFDPREHPNLSTGADMIGKSFFHAIGYFVPEAYIVYFRADDLRIAPGAQIRLQGDKKVPLQAEILQTMLDSAAHHPDGSVRAIVSLRVEGEVVGPFKFFGTRPDDPNDVFPHEHRRELRGYRVFCAWLNHDDSRAINTLDTYVGEEGKGHLRHYLIDFGSTLGAGSDHLRRIAPQDPRAGHEYVVDFLPTWRAAYSFGMLDRPWRKIDYPYPRYAEVGRIEGASFDPERWKPEYPNPAFDRMLADDAFWAAKIVARFSDEAIRAIVATGDYLSQQAERYLADTVIERRDRVVAHYFRRINPIDGFSAADGTLRFRHLGLEHGLGDVQGYEYEWFTFDNERESTTPLELRGQVRDESVPVPETASSYLMVRLRTLSEDEPLWRLAVDVYLRDGEVAGIEREIP